jgi:DNA-binding IscR family transcriptional regulator
MKLSTRGRYGVRAMLELAMQNGTGPMPLRDLASRQEISAK